MHGDEAYKDLMDWAQKAFPNISLRKALATKGLTDAATNEGAVSHGRRRISNANGDDLGLFNSIEAWQLLRTLAA